MIAFRDRPLAAPTLEAAYLALVRHAGQAPPLFLNQLVHLILRNALEGCDDPTCCAPAELFFRPQRASFHDGTVLLADAEVIEAHEAGRTSSRRSSPCSAEPAAELDVLDDGNAWTYWSRSDAFTMALNLGSNPRSREASPASIEAWVRTSSHRGAVEPVAAIEDRTGAGSSGSTPRRRGSATPCGGARSRGRRAVARVLALFRLTFAEPASRWSRRWPGIRSISSWP